MNLDLAGKVAIVTAATSNIGRAVVLELASEGAKLVMVGRDVEAGARLVKEARAKGATEAVFVVADLLDLSSPAKVLAAAAPLGVPAVLVNGLGGNVDQGLFVDSDPALWTGDIDLNLGTLLRMTHAVLPLMIAEGRGSIVNMGSTAGLVGDYMLPVYSAMKGAVHSFSVTLAKEVGARGVRVNAVAPYATFARDPGAFSAGSRFHPSNDFLSRSADLSEDDKAMRKRRTVVGRDFAVPEEISGLVAYLASDRASFVTGQVWAVDGGALL